jgi:hypothetical protein
MKSTFKAAGAYICVITSLLCISCHILGYDIKEDIIPSSFEPVAWKDSMIFLATDEGPCQVQLWDTETRTLVKRYVFGSMVCRCNVLFINIYLALVLYY